MSKKAKKYIYVSRVLKRILKGNRIHILMLLRNGNKLSNSQIARSVGGNFAMTAADVFRLTNLGILMRVHEPTGIVHTLTDKGEAIANLLKEL